MKQSRKKYSKEYSEELNSVVKWVLENNISLKRFFNVMNFEELDN